MTKENFIVYVRQYRHKLGYIRTGMKEEIDVGRDLFSTDELEEASKEYLVFWEFFQWIWFESGFSYNTDEIFTEKHLKKTFEAADRIAYNLMKKNNERFTLKIIKKTWNRFLANLMLEFEEVREWIDPNTI